MKSIRLLTGICFSALCRFAAAAGGEAVDLPGTTIEMPWNGFSALLSRAPDTVRIDRGCRAATPVVFDEARITAALFDSSAKLDLDVRYSVLDTAGWVTARIFGDGNEPSFTDIRMPAGDCCRSTADSGIVLLARPGKGAARSRAMRMQWVAAAETRDGARFVGIPVPRTPGGTITVEAPRGFTEVTVQGGVLLSETHRGGSIRYEYSLPPGGGPAALRYFSPVRLDSSKDTPEAIIKKDTLVTVVQETGLFLTDETIFCIAALRLSVSRAPLTRFSVSLPGGFSLLTVDGNGIGGWTPRGARAIEVELRFELSGEYVLFITGELHRDSVVAIPFFAVRGAVRQSGAFALMAAGATEAEVLALNGAAGMSFGEFSGKSSPAFRAKCAEYGKNGMEIIFAGYHNALPFDVRAKIRRHAIAPVVNALADVGTLETVVGADRAALTVATYDIRQRNRQFVSLMLPDSAELWSVSVAGDALMPLRGEGGQYKISLQRFMNTDCGERVLPLVVTYLERPPRSGGAMELSLRSPGIDMPVGKLIRTVFYPERWRVKSVRGDFLFSHGSVSAPESGAGANAYTALRERAERHGQNAIEGNAKLVSVLSEKSGSFGAYTILVVDERPFMNIRFGKTRPAMQLLVILAFCAAIAGAGTALAMRKAGRRLPRKR